MVIVTNGGGLLSCTWTFTATDTSANLVIGQRLKCGDGDELSLHDGGGRPKTISCCVDCTKTPEVTGPTATIGFTSDGTRNPNDIGFYLDIFAGKDESGCSNQNNTFNVSISSPYVITSPNFPSHYPNLIQCHYTFIPVPLSQGLVISFQFVNLDYDRGCYDKIILKEGDMNGNKIAEICKDYGQNNPVLSPNETYRTTGSLFLHFVSDSGYPARGFRAIVQQDSTSGNTESTTTVVTESTTKESTIQSTTAESTIVSTTNSESSTSQSPTSRNKESTTTVATESTTTESTTQSTTESTTVSATNSESTTSKSTTSGNTLTIVTTENTSPTPTVMESTTVQTTLESTTTEITTPASPTPKSPPSSTPKSQDVSVPLVIVSAVTGIIILPTSIVIYYKKYKIKTIKDTHMTSATKVYKETRLGIAKGHFHPQDLKLKVDQQMNGETGNPQEM
ncbi:mucin-2-like [Saccostrea echinata]|uniref:mucin-2-like n=1 Tax=Saccostrea echinata TaxID=191078 RepID=UPI002A807908|nr:mucin-2-like [Saccostrea echinata]